jgi:hypothetical protein
MRMSGSRGNPRWGMMARALGSAMLFALGAAAAASEWQRALESPQPVGWIPERGAPLPDGGYLLGGEVVGLGEVHQRFDAQGSPAGPVMAGPWPTLVARTDPAGPRPVAVLQEWMTDLMSGLASAPCERSLQANGVETRVLDFAMLQGHALGSLDAGDGSFAVSGRFAFELASRFHRYGPDCSLLTIAQYEFHTEAIANSSTSILAYALTSADGESQGIDTLRGVTPEGLAWSRQLPGNEAPLQDLRLLQEIEGDIVVGGVRGGAGRVLRVGPDGSVRWQRALPSTDRIIWGKATAAGLLVAASSLDSAPTNRLRFSLLDPTGGDLIWERLSDLGGGGVSLEDIPTTSASLALIAVHAATPGVLRIDPDGTLTHYAAIEPPYGALIELPDGRLLANGVSVEIDPDLQVPAAVRQALYTFDFATLDSPEPLDPLPLSLPALATVSAQDSDRIYAAETLGERLRITAIGMDGEPGWTTVLPEQVFRGHSGRPLQPSLAVGAESVCLLVRRERRFLGGGFPEGLDERLISCLDAPTGNVLAAHVDPMPPLAEGERRDVLLLRVLARSAGTVSVLVSNRAVFCQVGPSCISTYERLDVNGDGLVERVVLAELAAPGVRNFLIDVVEGPALLFDHFDLDSGQRELHRVALDGSHESLAQLPEGWRSLAEAEALPLEDQSVLYLSPDASSERLRLLRLSSQGAPLWNSEIALDPALLDPFEWQLLSASGDPGVGLALLLGVEGRAELIRLAPEGDLAWRRAATQSATERLAGVHADGARIQLVSRRADQLLLRSYAHEDGRELGFLREGIGAGLAGLDWTPEGDAVLATMGLNTIGLPLQGSWIRRMSMPAAEAPSFAAGSLAGAWYDPASTGQGLYLHYLADSASAVGTWFTFANAGGTDRADLRWYTLVGPASADASEAQLAIRVNESGRFDAPPATSSSEVGQATLRLLSCSTLAIDYALDPDTNAGKHGTLYLQRLTPSAACTGGAGSATSTPPGFWFEPATSGQGLALLPLGASDGTPGGLAGAWFTFDPEGLADDEGAQHWFTLIGGAPDDGRYRLQILRTIGAALDANPTRNTLRVGEAELRFTGCANATLDYAFDDADAAAEFGALQGSIPLQRIEPCPQ